MLDERDGCCFEARPAGRPKRLPRRREATRLPRVCAGQLPGSFRRVSPPTRLVLVVTVVAFVLFLIGAAAAGTSSTILIIAAIVVWLAAMIVSARQWWANM
jgi:hypothetical protein